MSDDATQVMQIQADTQSIGVGRVFLAGIAFLLCELFVSALVPSIVGSRNVPMHETERETGLRIRCAWVKRVTLSAMTLALVSCFLWLAKLNGVDFKIQGAPEADGSRTSRSLKVSLAKK